MTPIPDFFAAWWFAHFVGIGELPTGGEWVYWVDSAPANAQHVYSSTNGGVLHGIAEVKK